MNPNDFVVVLSTCPTAQAAEDLARELVGRGLAACVNIVPAVRSIYIWDGALQADDEVLMVIKATRAKFTDLRETLVARHPYEVPEVVALPVADGHHRYLTWLAAAAGLPPASPA